MSEKATAAPAAAEKTGTTAPDGANPGAKQSEAEKCVSGFQAERVGIVPMFVDMKEFQRPKDALDHGQEVVKAFDACKNKGQLRVGMRSTGLFVCNRPGYSRSLHPHGARRLFSSRT